MTRRQGVSSLTFDGATAPTRATDAPADVRPDVRPQVRASTRSSADVQAVEPVSARPTSGPGAHSLAHERAMVDAQRRRRARAQRELDAAARSYQAYQMRVADKLSELIEAAREAESEGMTLDEVRAVVVLAGLPADLIRTV